jgi:cytochrome c oxidase subunit IV
MSHDSHGTHEEHPPTTIRQYVMIGVILTVITAVELWASFEEELLGVVLIPALLIMSAVKFGIVVALFMHLRFDHPLFTRLFVFGLALASAIMVALLTLFWGGHHGIV